MVPENCIVIQNPIGTAPITWFEKAGKVIVSMPGVPSEMKNAMSTEIINRLQKKFNTPAIVHKTVLVKGYPESALAIKIADWENALPDTIHLAYLPNYQIVKLRLSGSSTDELALEFEINRQISQLTQLLGEAIIAYEDLPLEVLIGKVLKEKKMTIATAESCTGGNIAHKITEIAGSSQYFKGAVVAYDNDVKTQVLRVNPNTISTEGAVSAHVVEEMAVGVRKLMHTDIAITTSGIAGPTGGSDEKPVGLVWIGISTPEITTSRMFQFGKKRIENIERSTQSAFLFLLEILS
jgi:nicotinamide-nucleotide amidase